MIKAIIFDMDGTLVKSDDVGLSVVKIVTKKYLGLHLSKNEISEFIGIPDKEYYENILFKYNCTIHIEFILNQHSELYEKYLHQFIVPYIGVKETIKYLSSKYRLLLNSGSTRKQIEIILSKIGATKFFEYIVSRDDVCNGKPHPESYIKAIDYLNIPKNQILAVEDTESGILSAIHSGIKVVAFKNGYDHRIANANHHINNIYELTHILNLYEQAS